MSTTKNTARGVRTSNRLANEASPYLLQHARNPVDWWPWSQEALAEAKRRDVPILLSIGYSACHWCHVMERESFEDEEIAALMNERFVNIKVDREERPDLDQIYQLAVQLMGRTGGWPLTVFLTPVQKPFFAGTYFPPEERHGMPGFPKVLRAMSEAYRHERDDVDAQAIELTRAMDEVGRGPTDDSALPTLGADLLDRVSRLLLRRFDDQNGGFGRAPKFPNTMPLEVLLRCGVEGEGPSRQAARLQLDAMRAGGIWDHLGGGFHRYSTDERWLVPHFEKMLYDNALLLRSYVDGYRALGDSLFARTAHEIGAYVGREMTDPEGGYYASQDADSDGEEGKFFIWDEADVERALGDDEAAIRVALEYYGITRAGNFEDHGRPTFKTVLHESRPLRAVAAKLDRTEAEVHDALVRGSKAMFEARETRTKPLRDEKILTSWNALMIGAMAEAGVALDDSKMLGSAERAFAFIEKHLVVRDGHHARVARLAKRVEGGDRWLVKSPGFLDDHAYLANAALDLYEATGDPAKVKLARELADAIIDSFWTAGEGFYFTSKDGESLITRSKDPFDQAVPSGAAMANRAFSRLGALVDEKYRAIAEEELVRLAPSAMVNPFGYGQTLNELDRVVRGAIDVVLVGSRSDARTKSLARAVFSMWIPNRTVAWLDPFDPASRDACSVLAEGKSMGKEPSAFVCRGRSCALPVTTPEALVQLLD